MSKLVVVEKTKPISRVSSKTLLREILKITAGIALMTLSSKIRFILPFTGVPFTLQTFALTLIILLMNKRAFTVLASYLVLGLIGIPVFALGGGPLYMLSPTFGYLLGFVLASLWGYWISSEIHKPSRYILLVILVMSTVYALGFAWLTLWFKVIMGLGILEAMTKAFLVGIAPFIIWDLLKGYMALPVFFSLKFSRKHYKLVS